MVEEMIEGGFPHAHELFIKKQVTREEYDKIFVDSKRVYEQVIEDQAWTKRVYLPGLHLLVWTTERPKSHPVLGDIIKFHTWYNEEENAVKFAIDIALETGKNVRYGNDIQYLRNLMAGFRLFELGELIGKRVLVTFDVRGYVWYIKPWEDCDE